MTRTLCPHCRKKLDPGQRIHPDCIEGYATAQGTKAERARGKAHAVAAKMERADTARRKSAIKSIGKLIEEAQTQFNRWVNLRDAGKPCICCGRPMETDVMGKPKVNAGHWRSRGSSSHLRFDEANCHSQRVSCNRPGGARTGAFREGMIARVGLEEVERLEADNHIEKWQRDELIAIKTTYARKLRALKESRE